MKKISLLLTILLSCQLLHAENNYLGALGIKTTSTIVNDKYCQRTKEKNILCMEYQLEYPKTVDSNNKTLNDYILHAIQPYKDAYKNGDAKKYIDDFLEEESFDVSGSWSNETSVTLFSTTPKTFTLSISNGGYMGGAHGNYAIGYNNYNAENGKKITLETLLVPDYKKRLTAIAGSYYKKLHNLKTQESLTKLGWFDNKFVLAENVSVTEKGLYFLYNSYEIKPYSAGQTSFLLPYDKIASLIPKDSLLFPLVTATPHSIHKVLNDPYKANIILDITPIKNHQMTLVVKVENLSFYHRGWFSISFPSLTATKSVIRMTQSGFDSIKAYKKGSKVYHRTLKKAIQSQYLLVETESKIWKTDEEKSITLTLQVPQNVEDFFIDFRASFRNKDGAMSLVPDAYNTVVGQQGFDNYRIRIPN